MRIKDLIIQAMWDGDNDRLYELAACKCCCNEHTFDDCLARVWYGCRGQSSITRQDIEGWAKHYGMTVDQFYNWGYDPEDYD